MPAAVAATSAPTMTADGRVPGVDGMLDQVAEALVRQVSADHDLQMRVGAAAGRALADRVIVALFVAGVANWFWKALPAK